MSPESSEASANESSPATPEFKDAQFPVVGIGASAGGLEAFGQLLRQLPDDTGMAFVLISHLAPQYSSALSEILARSSAMPVNEVRDGMGVQPNCVYVIPPNTEMMISDGTLKLMARPSPPVHSMPIDFFLRSLAEDRRERAIGVILSGTASDGTLGLQAIKAEAGLTFAQDEASAKYPGMPHSAIAAGFVDVILPPDGIAREIARISRHPYLGPAKAWAEEGHQAALSVEAAASAQVPADEMGRILALLRTATGNDFSHYKRSMIARRIRRRMVLNNTEDLVAYARFLEENRAEAEALGRDVLINVTGFFRDPAVFDALTTIVFPRLLQNRPADGPLRIWVPACSTGEEAYSIAICAVEYLSETRQTASVQIFGTDISELNIAKARGAHYREADVVEIPPTTLRRYLTRLPEGYQINKSIRDICIFARQNLIKDPPFSRLDLISCRNFLIYLDSTLQKKVMPTFHYALQPGGFLLLGSSESASQFSDLFTPVDKSARIFARKPKPSAVETSLRPVEMNPSQPRLGTGSTIERDPQVEFQKELNRLLQSEYTMPGLVVNQDLEIVQFVGRVGPFLDPVAGAATTRLPKMAREGLALELRAAIHRAQKEYVTVVKEGVQLTLNGRPCQVRIEVRPLKAFTSGERQFLVIFQETPPPAETALPQAADPTSLEAEELRRLRQELEETKEQLQDIIEEQEAGTEELRSANEEIQSSNEELQSSNEELETAKEELQAGNEELTTVNEELQNRNLDLTTSNNDLNNVISNVASPMIVLGRDLRIRRFTPNAETILNLIPSDEGRPITDLRPGLEVPDLDQLIADAVKTGELQDREVQDSKGHWHSLRIRPYRTSENKIEGAVLSLVDIDALKSEVTALHQYADAIVETAREPILVLDHELHIKAANRSFYETFRISASESENRFLYEIGNAEWDIPKLRELLEEILPEKREFRNFLVEQEFPGLGRRVMMLNARQIVGERQPTPLIVLAIEDVTEQEHARQVIERQALLLDLALDAIMIHAEDGTIDYWNRGAERLYGWTREEAVGRRTHELLKTFFPMPLEEIKAVLLRDGHWEGDLRHTKSDGGFLVVLSYWTLLPGRPGDAPAWMEINRDITQMRQAETAVAQLSRQLLAVQDEERRRFARELHDGPAQTLSAITLNLAMLQRFAGTMDDRGRKALADAFALTEGASAELRSISYLMHPPALARQGLATTLEWFVKGLAKRSKIEARLILPSEIGQLPEDVETALFRVVQEGLTNVQRHSKSPSVAVELRVEGGNVILEIKDNGRGIPPEILQAVRTDGLGLGVGLRGMRERARQLGGAFEVESGPQGTTVRVSIPVAPPPM